MANIVEQLTDLAIRLKGDGYPPAVVERAAVRMADMEVEIVRLSTEVEGAWHDHGIMKDQYLYWSKEAKRLSAENSELQAAIKMWGAKFEKWNDKEIAAAESGRHHIACCYQVTGGLEPCDCGLITADRGQAS